MCTASVIAGKSKYAWAVSRFAIVDRPMQLVSCLYFKYPVSSGYAMAICIDYIKAPI